MSDDDSSYEFKIVIKTLQEQGLLKLPIFKIKNSFEKVSKKC